MPTSSTAAARVKLPESVMAEFSETKRCSKCIERLPLTAFRRQRAGSLGRHAECNRCRNLRETPQVAGKRRAVRRQELLSRLAKLMAMRSQRRHAALLEDTITMFNGPQRLAEEFRAVFDDARERGDLRTASKILLAIGSLCQREDPLREASLDTGQPATSTVHLDGKRQQPETPDLSQMSDAELVARVRQLKRTE